MTTRTFSQVDVFAARPFAGNPVAVVHDADGMTDAEMAAFARWTNLSETTFLFTPRDARADYRLRIFTPNGELPFAGHPTLGSAHAWLEMGGKPRGQFIVQECGIGVVRLRLGSGTLAFAAPELIRSGEIDSATLAQATASVGVSASEVLHAAWVDNGPGWLGLVLDSPETVLGLKPDFAVMGDLKVGVLATYDGGETDAEVRAFVPGLGVPEDPVTGSLNAGFAVWLSREGILPPSYTVRQGTAIGRDGRVVITTVDNRIWVGGTCTTRVRGTLEI